MSDVRRCFIPRKGHFLALLDYAQIELRLFAWASKEPTMLQALTDGEDLHTRTALAIFGGSPTKEQRQVAKSANFALIYGAGAEAFKDYLFKAADVVISLQESVDIVRSFHATYPSVRQYMRRVTDEVVQRGYAENAWGLRYPIEDVRDAYKGVNYETQGNAAMLIKYSMVRLGSTPTYMGLRAHMLSTVHDELIFEVPIDWRAPALIDYIKYKMANWPQFSPPGIVVTCQWSVKSWGDKEPWQNWSGGRHFVQTARSRLAQARS